MSTRPESERAIESLAAAARTRGHVLTMVKVAKLLYLADLRAVRHDGQTYSGIRWVWDNHGPWNNSLYRHLENVEREGSVEVWETKETFGKTRNIAATAAATVDEADRFVVHIEAVLEAYGAMSPAELRDLTYQTPPMLKAQREGSNKKPLDLTVRPMALAEAAAQILTGDEPMFDDEDDDALPRWKEHPGGDLMGAGRALYRRH